MFRAGRRLNEGGRVAVRSRFLSIADQGVNSVSNFALVALAAVASTPVEFGQFSIAYAFFLFFLGAGRALVGETLLVRESRQMTAAPGAVMGAALTFALPGGVLLGVIALFIPDPFRVVWFALAVAAVVAPVQDALRFIALAEGRSDRALLLDAIWTVPAIAAMIPLAWAGVGAAWIVAVWLGGAVVSLLVGALLSRAVPRPWQGMRWLGGHRSSAVRYVLEFSSLNASTLLVWVLLAPLLGAAAVGALRGAQLLMSPLNTVFASLRIAMIPELIRVADSPRYRRRLWELAGILSVAVVLWGGAVLIIDGGIGRLILGATWDGAEPLRGAFVAQYIALAGYTLLLTMFRVHALDRASSRMRGLLAVATLALPLALAVPAGAIGAAWGFTAAVALASVAGIVLLVRSPRA